METATVYSIPWTYTKQCSSIVPDPMPKPTVSIFYTQVDRQHLLTLSVPMTSLSDAHQLQRHPNLIWKFCCCIQKVPLLVRLTTILSSKEQNLRRVLALKNMQPKLLVHELHCPIAPANWMFQGSPSIGVNQEEEVFPTIYNENIILSQSSK